MVSFGPVVILISNHLKLPHLYCNSLDLCLNHTPCRNYHGWGMRLLLVWNASTRAPDNKWSGSMYSFDRNIHPEKLNFFYTLCNVVHYEIIQQRTHIISSLIRCCLIIRIQINLISRDNVNIESVETRLPTIINSIGRHVGKW